jgi:alpha-L-rhamnosidase
VTASLRPGLNAIGLILGRGWFDERARTPWWFAQAPWRARVRVRLQLEVEILDGTRRSLGTDASWRTADSHIIEDGVRTGEVVDGRRELLGWDQPGFDDRDWRPVHVVPGPGGRLVARTLPIRVTETVPAAAVRAVRPGIHVVDVGRDVAGWLRMRVDGPAGTRVTLRHGERLGADGDLDQSLLDRFHDPEGFQRDAYILRGGGPETFEPRFTYHGFRYVRVEGYPGEPDREAFAARVVHSAFPQVGRFRCSEPLLDAIHAAALAAFRGNFVGFPTDCPHREKNGWLDAHLHAELGLYHFGVADGYRTWLDAIGDCQRADGALPAIVPSGGWGYSFPPGDDVAGPAWDSACIQLPWTLYRFTGDASVLARHHGMMTRYLAQLGSLADGHIVDGGLGDWCPPGGQETHRTPWALTSTAFFHLDALTLADVADVLGRQREARHNRARAAHIRKAFNGRFLDPETGWYEGREMTAQAVPLAFGLVPRAHRERVVARLLDAVREADHGAYFGILGARFVLRVLAEHGYADEAFAIVNRTTFPGWGHWIAQGATTLWERWEGTDSLNHAMFGDVAAWMMAVLAGIRPDDAAPGFRRTIIEPHPVVGLDWAEGEHDSPYGRIRSAWRREDGRLTLEVELPPGTSGHVRIPATEGAVVRASGRDLVESLGLRVLGRDGARVVGGSARACIGSR